MVVVLTMVLATQPLNAVVSELEVVLLLVMGVLLTTQVKTQTLLPVALVKPMGA